MKQTKSKPKKEDKTIIGDEWNEEDHPIFSCSWCNRTLIRLSDRNNQSESWFCRNCQIGYPDITETRKKSKLGPQHEEVESAISSVGEVPDVSISHTVPIRGGFAELQKKGLRIKDYRTTEKE